MHACTLPCNSARKHECYVFAFIFIIEFLPFDVDMPSSSTSTRLRAVAQRRMWLTSRISHKKVPALASMLSPLAMRVSTVSVGRRAAKEAGTKHPTWAMITSTPTVRRKVDLPWVREEIRGLLVHGYVI